MADEGKWIPDWVGDEWAPEAPMWVAAFLTGLIVTGILRQALDEAGIDFDTAWALRRAEPEFAMYWDRAMRAHRRIAAGVPFWEVLAGEAASGGVH